MKGIGFVVAAVLVAVVACGEPQRELESGTMGTNAEVGDVVLRNVFIEAPAGHAYQAGEDAVVRLAMFTRAGKPDELVSVRSAGARQVVMRADRDCDGTDEDVGSLAVPVDDTGLGRGGLTYHLLLVDLTDEVLAGTTVPLDFTFRDAGGTRVSAMVEAAGDGDVPTPTGCDRAGSR